MPDRYLADATPDSAPVHEDVQQLIEAESGKGTQGIRRAWQASDSARVVLTSDPNGVRISRDNGTTAPAQVIVDGTAAGGSLTGTYPNPTVQLGVLDAICPPGAILAYGGPVAPGGFILCDGRQVSRTGFPRLFAAISTNWGAGDGSTTFNVPDLRGRFPLGSSATHGFTLPGGNETVATPHHNHPDSHDHAVPDHNHGQATHTHDLANHHHDTPGHSHTVNIDHDHPNASAAAAASGSTLNGRFTAGGVNTLPDTHTHDVNLPTLGTTNVTPPNGPTLSAGTPLGAGGAAANTSGQAFPSTTDPVTNVRVGASPTGAYQANADAIPIMPPFLAVQYIIRTG